MAALRVAGRRAASSPISAKLCGGGDTGLVLYAASNVEPLRTPPPALYRGGPSSFSSGGRWAALLTRGVRTSSTLVAPPPTPAGLLGTGDKIADLRFPRGAVGQFFLGTGGGAFGGNPCFPGDGGVGRKAPVLLFSGTGDKLFPGTGGGAARNMMGGSVFLGTGEKIGGTCFLGTNGAPVHIRNDNPVFLGTGDKIGGPRFLGTIAGAGGSLHVTSARRCLWPVNPYPICAARAFSTVPRKDDSGTFSRLYSIEHKLGFCQKLIEDAHKSAASNAEKLIAMIRALTVEQARILETTKGVMTLRRVLLWSPLLALLVCLVLFLAGLLGVWFLARLECKTSFSEFAISVLHQVLQDPTLKKDVEPYMEMGYDAVRRAVDPPYRWWQWWMKGKQDDAEIISSAEFSDKATSFAFGVLTLLTSSDGICEEEHLLKQLRDIGFDQKITNVDMLDFLSKNGYITKERKIGPQGTSVVYHPAEAALKECTSGLMKNRIMKAVKSNGTLSDMMK